MQTVNSTIVVDCGFGDNGKGPTVHELCRLQPNSVVVRFHGGAQAAHNVVLADGRHHTFSQFGSGSFLPGVRTHLSRFMLCDPMSLANEAKHLYTLTGANPYVRMTVDERALLVTPFHKAANRVREFLRGDGRHGSCGMGIGEATRDAATWPQYALHAGDIRSAQRLTKSFEFLQECKRHEFQAHLGGLIDHPVIGSEAKLLLDSDIIPWLVQAYQKAAAQLTVVSAQYLWGLAAEAPLVFEGAQGVLLDENYGFHPYTTWSTTTTANALALLDEIQYRRPVRKLGVLRTYCTRHGAGPFPTEDAQLTATMPDIHNGTGQWQGTFRVGYFDAVLARYALAATNGVDGIVLTHLDRIPNQPQLCVGYQLPNGETINQLAVPLDRPAQEQLTQLVQSVVPVYQPAPTDPQEYAATVAQTLGVAVAWTTASPVSSNITL